MWVLRWTVVVVIVVVAVVVVVVVTVVVVVVVVVLAGAVVVVVVVGQTIESISSKSLAYNCFCTAEGCKVLGNKWVEMFTVIFTKLVVVLGINNPILLLLRQ